jgi:hypothetical protein
MGTDVTATILRSEAFQRGARMLRTALGPTIAELLADPAVVEVMLNPDGCLWVDRLGAGLADTGQQLSPGYCQVNLPASQKPFPHPDVHAAVVAAAHV